MRRMLFAAVSLGFIVGPTFVFGQNSGEAVTQPATTLKSEMARAVHAMKKKEWKAAEEAARAASSLDASSIDARTLLCYVLIESKQLDAAAAELEQASKLASTEEAKASVKMIEGLLLAARKPGTDKGPSSSDGTREKVPENKTPIELAEGRWNAMKPSWAYSDSPWLKRVDQFLVAATRETEPVKPIDSARLKQRAEALEQVKAGSPGFEAAANAFLDASIALLQRDAANVDLWALRMKVAEQTRNIRELWFSGRMCEVFGGEQSSNERTLAELVRFQDSLEGCWPLYFGPARSEQVPMDPQKGVRVQVVERGTGVPLRTLPLEQQTWSSGLAWIAIKDSAGEEVHLSAGGGKLHSQVWETQAASAINARLSESGLANLPSGTLALCELETQQGPGGAAYFAAELPASARLVIVTKVGTGECENRDITLAYAWEHAKRQKWVPTAVAPPSDPLPGEPITGQQMFSLPSGLRYVDLVEGNGSTPPDPNSLVRMHYGMLLMDGTLVDSSVSRGEPLEIHILRQIAGCAEGLQTMRVGGKRKLIIPPDLAFGNQGRGTIPPDSTLVFDVELLAVVDGGGGTAQTRPEDNQRTAQQTGTVTAGVHATQLTFVRLETSKGDIVLELDAERAPVTVRNFVEYVQKGHYSNTLFHRVISNFMIQGGGLTVDMKEVPTGPGIKNEGMNGLKNVRGSVAMARTAKADSATAQFFINTVDSPSLDGTPSAPGYAVFGRVVVGMDVVDQIRSVKTTRKSGFDDVPVEPIIIKAAKVITAEEVKATPRAKLEAGKDIDKNGSSLKVTKSPTPPDHSVGKTITAFEAKDTEGKAVKFPADYKGKVVLVDFWATWCGPCMREMPNLVKAYGAHNTEGFEILGISLDDENGVKKMDEVMKKSGMTWRQVADGKGWKAEIAQQYVIDSIPATFLVDGTTGKIIRANLRGEALEAAVTKAVAENKK